MSMRRTIGISLACLVTGACAIDKTPEEESISPYPGETADLPPGNGETPTGESPGFAKGLITLVGSPIVTSEPAEQPFAGFKPAADGRADIPKPCCRGWRTTGTTLFGKAAWYNFVGRQTASGEILDTVTATRTASLASTRLLREGDEPRQSPLGPRQSQRPGSIHCRTHPRPIAARCRRTRYETHRGSSRRR
jgi:hypothetical protein